MFIVSLLPGPHSQRLLTEAGEVDKLFLYCLKLFFKPLSQFVIKLKS